MVSLPLGQGKIIIISDPYLVYNQGVGKEDNIVLLNNIVAKEAGSGKVFFDEYDHGFRTSRGLFNYFKGTPLAWIFLQLSLFFILLVYSKAKHFGCIRSLPAPERRSSLEYVDAMSGIYQKAGVYSLGLADIYNRFKSFALGVLSFDGCLQRKDFILSLSQRLNREKSELEKIINSCEDVLDGASVSVQDALFLAQELDKIKKELSYV